MSEVQGDYRLYSTGEVARLCNVSVRTVQYYDSRNILTPSELSEGKRRLYSAEDVRKMQIICFLREMGFSIDNIGLLFSEENPQNTISMLMKKQEDVLVKELQERQDKLTKLVEMKRSLKNFEHFSVQSLGDIAHVMRGQKKRRHMLIGMVAVGLLMDVIEVGSLVYGFRTGIWWPVAAGLPVVMALGIFISRYYFRHVDYICPACHAVLKPGFRQMFWAAHTPNTRRLTCTACGHKGFCVETYAE